MTLSSSKTGRILLSLTICGERMLDCTFLCVEMCACHLYYLFFFILLGEAIEMLSLLTFVIMPHLFLRVIE